MKIFVLLFNLSVVRVWSNFIKPLQQEAKTYAAPGQCQTKPTNQQKVTNLVQNLAFDRLKKISVFIYSLGVNQKVKVCVWTSTLTTNWFMTCCNMSFPLLIIGCYMKASSPQISLFHRGTSFKRSSLGDMVDICNKTDIIIIPFMQSKFLSRKLIQPYSIIKYHAVPLWPLHAESLWVGNWSVFGTLLGASPDPDKVQQRQSCEKITKLFKLKYLQTALWTIAKEWAANLALLHLHNTSPAGQDFNLDFALASYN